MDNKGVCGFVSLVREIETNKQFAVKTYMTRDTEAIETIKTEFLRIKTLNHSNLVKYHKLYIDTYEGKVYLVMDYFPGVTLSKYIKTCGSLNETTLKTIVQQLITAVVYLHSTGIVHRDIKPENILISFSNTTRQLNLKLIDFSVAAFNDPKPLNPAIHNNYLMSDRTGTVFYRAPETFNKIEYTEAVDIWSIGCTLYECVFAKRLVANGSIHQLIQQKNVFSFYSNYYRHSRCFSSELIDLIENMLKLEMSERITGSMALRHKWFMGGEYKARRTELGSKRYSCLGMGLGSDVDGVMDSGRFRLKSFS